MTRHGGRAYEGLGRREKAFVPRSPWRARGEGSSTAVAMRTEVAVERIRNSGAGALCRSLGARRRRMGGGDDARLLCGMA